MESCDKQMGALLWPSFGGDQEEYCMEHCMATFAGNIRSIGATILRVPFARHVLSNFRTICKVGSLIRSYGFKVTQLVRGQI